jgi:hypothetical protein
MLCDCGYDFLKRKMPRTEKPVVGRTTLSWGMILLCLIIPLLGFFLFFAYRSQGRKGAANVAALMSFINLLAGAILGGPSIDIRFFQH